MRRRGKTASIAVASLRGRVLFLGHNCPRHSRGRSIFPADDSVWGSLRHGGQCAFGGACCRRKGPIELARRVSALGAGRPLLGPCQLTHVLGLHDGSERARSGSPGNNGTLDDSHGRPLARHTAGNVKARVARHGPRPRWGGAARRDSARAVRIFNRGLRTARFIAGVGFWFRLAIAAPVAHPARTRVFTSDARGRSGAAADGSRRRRALERERPGNGVAGVQFSRANRLVDWLCVLRLHFAKFVPQNCGSVHVREPRCGHLGGLVVARGTCKAAFLVGFSGDYGLGGAGAARRNSGRGTPAALRRGRFNAPACVNLTVLTPKLLHCLSLGRALK